MVAVLMSTYNAISTKRVGVPPSDCALNVQYTGGNRDYQTEISSPCYAVSHNKYN